MSTKYVKGLTGRKPMDLKRGVDITVNALMKDIERRSKEAQSSQEIAGRAEIV